MRTASSPTGGTFNWGGITFNISGNTYFVNPRIGYHGDYLRMTPSWYTLGWVTSTSTCNYYGNFLEDDWLYPNAKVSNSSS